MASSRQEQFCDVSEYIDLIEMIVKNTGFTPGMLKTFLLQRYVWGMGDGAHIPSFIENRDPLFPSHYYE